MERLNGHLCVLHGRCVCGSVCGCVRAAEQHRQQLMMEEQRKLVQQKAQTEAQLARYNDELARKRMQVGRHSLLTWIP